MRKGVQQTQNGKHGYNIKLLLLFPAGLWKRSLDFLISALKLLSRSKKYLLHKGNYEDRL